MHATPQRLLHVQTMHAWCAACGLHVGCCTPQHCAYSVTQVVQHRSCACEAAAVHDMCAGLLSTNVSPRSLTGQALKVPLRGSPLLQLLAPLVAGQAACHWHLIVDNPQQQQAASPGQSCNTVQQLKHTEERAAHIDQIAAAAHLIPVSGLGW